MILNKRLDPYSLSELCINLENFINEIDCDYDCEHCLFGTKLENPIERHDYGCVLGETYFGIIQLLKEN